VKRRRDQTRIEQHVRGHPWTSWWCALNSVAIIVTDGQQSGWFQ
jgi:hypothetical protein